MPENYNEELKRIRALSKGNQDNLKKLKDIPFTVEVDVVHIECDPFEEAYNFFAKLFGGDK